MMRRSSADRHGPELLPNNSMQRTALRVAQIVA